MTLWVRRLLGIALVLLPIVALAGLALWRMDAAKRAAAFETVILLGTILGVVVLCVGCAAFGIYLLLPREKKG